MRKNSLGDRMKEYERTSDTKLVRRLPMIVRIDGKAFHSWTKNARHAHYDRLIEVMKGAS